VVGAVVAGVVVVRKDVANGEASGTSSRKKLKRSKSIDKRATSRSIAKASRLQILCNQGLRGPMIYPLVE